MILTTYAVHQLNKHSYWVLTEGLHCGEKKVVIHEYKDGILGWASGFADVTQARQYWEYLEAHNFSAEEAQQAWTCK